MAANNVVPTADFATGGFAITPADGADLDIWARGIWVGGAGAVKIDTTNGSTITLSGAAAGTLLRVCAKRVYSTGTTASLLVGLY